MPLKTTVLGMFWSTFVGCLVSVGILCFPTKGKHNIRANNIVGLHFEKKTQETGQVKSLGNGTGQDFAMCLGYLSHFDIR